MAILNHIGIAIADRARMEKLFSILGFHIKSSEKVEDQGVTVHFLPLPGQAPNLEFLDPLGPESPVAQFISKRGPGIHHLSFEVKVGELTPLSDRLRKEGFKLLYDQPKKGAHQMMVNFIHPASCGGILVELTEPGEEG